MFICEQVPLIRIYRVRGDTYPHAGPLWRHILTSTHLRRRTDDGSQDDDQS